MRTVRQNGRESERGFALLLVFCMAAAVAIMLYMEMPRVAFETQRSREQLLVERGEEYQRAIKLYVRKFARYPQSLDDLEKSHNIRFLRKRFRDPLTGKDEWRLVHTNGMFLTDSLVEKPPDLNAKKEEPAADPNQTGTLAQMAQRRPSDRGVMPPPGFDPNAQSQDPNNPNAVNPGGPPPPGQPQPVGQYPQGVPYPGQPGQPGQPPQTTPSGVPYPGQQQTMPSGVPYPGQQQTMPSGVPYPGQQQTMPSGVPYPGQQQTMPSGVPYPGQQQTMPSGVPYPGQQQPGQQQPGQQQPGQQLNPGQPQPYPAQRPGVPFPVGVPQPQGFPQPVPGQPPGTPGAQPYPAQQPYPVQQPYPGQPQNPAQQQQQYPAQQPYPVQPAGIYPVPIPAPGNRPGPPSPYPPAPVNPQMGGVAPFPYQQNPQGPQNRPTTGQNQAIDLIKNILTNPRPGGLLGTPQQSGGSTFGAGIAGVASTAEGDGIRIYNERTKYKEWEFVYDPKKDRAAMGGMAIPGQQQQGGQQTGSGQGSSFGVQGSGFGGPGSGFGGGQPSGTVAPGRGR